MQNSYTKGLFISACAVLQNKFCLRFSPVSKMTKVIMILRMSYAAKFENKTNMVKCKVIPFVPIIALSTLEVVLLQLSGILMIWKIQKAR